MLSKSTGVGGFSLRFDRLDDFLLTQRIYLDEPLVNELASRYVGNSLQARSEPIMLTFMELEELLE